MGGQALAPDDVSRYRVREEVERDWDGQWLCFTAYAIIASLLLGAVATGQLAPNFLIAVLFVGVLGVLSLLDALSVPALRIWRFEVVTRHGARLDHTTSDLAETQSLMRRLDTAVFTTGALPPPCG